MTILHFSEEHNQFRERLKAFFKEEVTPHVDQWEKDGQVPKSAWKRMGAEGFLSTSVDKAYGGPGRDFLYSVIIMEEMAQTNHHGFMASMHSDIIVPYIVAFGTEEIKQKYLPGCASGDVITAIAMTEPGTGSDLAAITCTAVEDGDDVIINGAKTFISNGVNFDIVIVAGKDPDIENNYDAISLYIVEDGTPGLSRGRHLEKMGLHSQDTTELFLTDCRIPKKNRLGDKGGGFLMLIQKLQQERLVCAVGCMAEAELLLKTMVDHCKKTKVNGKPLCKSQAVQFTLAEMATEVALNRSFVNQIIMSHMNGDDVIAETMMAKYSTSEMLNQWLDRSLDLFGDAGTLESCPIARNFRDARVTTIFAGTTEIMKTIIAKSMGL